MRLILVSLAAVVSVFTSTSMAYASADPTVRLAPISTVGYIDPTAGGVLIQMLLAGAAGILGLVGIFWTRIRSRFSLRRKKPQKDIADHADSVDDKESESQ